MLDESTRGAVLRLRKQGYGTRTIAKMLDVSRGAVQDILGDGRAEVPPLERPEKADGQRDRILELYADCGGNLVRVHEELTREGVEVSYSALTAFCRRHGLGRERPHPAGQYHFKPGQEMQHDTSPHHAEIAGQRRDVQSASIVFCYSRMIFVQMYPRFTRFECKVFLTDAFQYFQAVCERCMTDNTHVIVLSGTGRDMVPVPEMAVFAERFGFEWRAHELGDANRSARVERPMHFIEKNFLAGRRFADWQDLNAEARLWCDRVNAKHRRSLHASPRELFAAERVHLKQLPGYVPEVYALHQRIVDTEGYVNVHRNRYSVPWQLIGRMMEVREAKDRIDVFEGPRRVATHTKVLDPTDARVTLAEHRPPRTEGVLARQRSEGEQRLVQRVPEAGAFIALLRKQGRASVRNLRWLLRMVDEYPREPLIAALGEACRYGMIDLARLERMVLRGIARDFFVLPRGAKTDPEEDQ